MGNWFRFYGGSAIVCGGAFGLYYAHYHDPTPTADPEAVHLLSHAAYHLLYFGGLALMIVGVLLVLASVIRGVSSWAHG
jgi:cytochrome b561